MDNKKMTIALLGVVAVLLAVIAGILVFKTSPSVPTAGTDSNVAATGTNGTNQLPSTAPGATTPVTDPGKATKVPDGVTPEAFVENYFKAITKGDFAAAYKMLPADKAAAQTEQQYAETLKGYGFTGYQMGTKQDNGDKVIVQATANTKSGNFPYTFTFQKYKNGYVLMSRALSGMSQ